MTTIKAGRSFIKFLLFFNRFRKKIKDEISATRAAEMEKLKLMAKDVQENMKRIEKVKNFKNFKVLEKHMQK